MTRLAKLGPRGEYVRELARDLRARGGGPQAIRDWLSRRFCFVRDPPGVELLKSPRVLLQERDDDGCASGDCDDAAILAAALALASHYPVRFVVLGFRPRGPFAHVYAEAWDGSRWIDFDVTRPAQFPPGLRVHRRRVFLLR